ncbi:MAG: hypothetical protein ICV64_01330 [Thermoleophilia bacterium]|nr:hypothetical protein [Thermoleophilia bacterium]
MQPISVADAGFFRSGDFYLRVSAFGLVTFALFALLGLRLWSLQLVQGPRLAAEAKRDVFRHVRLPAPRAAIEDAEGRLLVGTDGRVSVTADADALGALDERGRWHPSAEGRAVLRRFSRLSRVPLPRLLRRIEREQLRAPHAPAVIIPRAERALAVYLDERPGAFPGVSAAPYPQRSYPQGRIGGEFLGLLGEINADQLKRRPRRRPGEVIGQSGVEARYDRYLNLGLARARVAVDARGRPIGPLTILQQPRPNRVLRLTIDIRIQRAAERAITNALTGARRRGKWDARGAAAVVMDARTGALRALATAPGFNQVAAARDPDYLEQVLSSEDRMLNRAIAGTYPTGSTFKPIVAQAALAAGLIDTGSTIYCSSTYWYGGREFKNAAPMEASLRLRDALKYSCDTWFYRLGAVFYERQRRGSLDIQRWARRLGLGAPTGVDVPGEAAGIVPTPQWVRNTLDDPTWHPGQSINLSIGQGFLTASPLQMAVAYAALANGGRVVQPHVAEGLYDLSGKRRKRFRWKARRVSLPGVHAIREGVYAAANLPGGTSYGVFADFPVKVAGKTGTAEVPPSPNDHSWYASWAPHQDPRYVVVVLVEHGGFGADAAAPAAREIYEALFRIPKGNARRQP